MLKPVERRALTLIRNRLVHFGQAPSVRELSKELGFQSPRSAALIIGRLIDEGYLKRRDGDRALQLLKMPNDTDDRVSTVSVPLVGSAPCGAPLLAEQNIEAWYPVSSNLARQGAKYFLVRARGDSMDEAGIADGSLVLVKQQEVAETGDVVVALVDDEVTIKELRLSSSAAALIPRSSNKSHRPILATREMRVQGVVVASVSDALE
ncbi:MAG: repressor LexA [Proteobacteria bacterium]|nr:repressor LexA [Pseudomonadota bacterium]